MSGILKDEVSVVFKELGYSNNTSSMLKHYRALHENKETNQGGPSPGKPF